MPNTRFWNGVSATRSRKLIELLPLTTLVPCIFTIIAIVFIQIGGVDSHDETVENLHLNFPLLRVRITYLIIYINLLTCTQWKYTVESAEGIKTFTEHLYLNRACITRQTNKSSSIKTALCHNIHDQSYDATTFSAIANTVESLPKGPLNLKMTQGLYTGSAGLVLIIMILPAILGFLPKSSKKNFRYCAVFIALVCLQN